MSEPKPKPTAQAESPAPTPGPPTVGAGGREARSFVEVLDEELLAVHERRRRTGGTDRAPAGGDAVERAHDAQLLGLAFSGGGIRSAVFNLGVAGALARLGLLRRLDYLSVNSGGGYMGGWLLAWIRRAGIAAVERALAGPNGGEGRRDQEAEPGEPASSQRSPEPSPVSFLRRFSNYLTPRVGAFSADTWTFVATYVRNLLLNQSVLVLALGAILLGPRFVVLVSESFAGSATAALAAAAVCLGVAVVVIGANLLALNGEGEPGSTASEAWYTRLPWVQLLVVVPLFGAAWLCGVWMWFSKINLENEGGLTRWLAARWRWYGARVAGSEEQFDPLTWALLAAAAYSGIWLVAGAVGALRQRPWRKEIHLQDKGLWASVILAAPAAGAFGGLLLHLVAAASDGLGDALSVDGEHQPWHLFHVNVWKPPAITLVFMLTAFLHTGLMGRVFPESHRQWWSRLGAWMLIYGLTWAGVFGVALYAPILLVWLGFLKAEGVGAGWLATTMAGVRAGQKGAGPAGGQPPLWRRALLAAAPQIFIVGMLALVALGLHALLSPPESALPSDCRWFWPPPTAEGAQAIGFREILQCHSDRMWLATLPTTTWWLFLLLAGAALLFSWRVDINQFSMHLFYRNRLIRAFLGASNPARRPQPFTGFDPRDDLALTRLTPPPWGDYDGPYPIYNVALNLVAGEELAWQERKAASFVFTPRHSGFEVRPAASGRAGLRRLEAAGFRPTAGYEQTPDGLTLGTAMGISGAAVSPNMGAQSSAAMAFLLTMFNVRLGWWLGNPRVDRTWRRMGPRVGLLALLSELFGLSKDSSSFVYLSDGGHFDNLGLYELVRRRCRFIVISDAGADPDATFDDLGGAIRKCRTDFGIDIDLDVDQLRHKPGSKECPWHVAVGRIRYERVDPGATAGTLVYLKASLTGDEPEDVQNYAAANPLFPHESTADQWFGESQFESYRKLGEHVTRAALGAVDAPPAELGTEELFLRLRRAWYPPSACSREAFSHHKAGLDALMERLRTDDTLAFMTAQLYPEWAQLNDGFEGTAAAGSLPSSTEELRSGLYFCTSLLQLAENVYRDLDLDHEHDHPDNRGWMNLFHFWAGSAMVRVTWAIQAASFGARFQTFAERHLGLSLGRVGARLLADGGGPEDLTPAEGRILRDLQEAWGDAVEQVFAFEVAVAHPRNTGEDGGRETILPVGFAICSGGRLLYFRIQEHLRRVGLARLALVELVRRHDIHERSPVELPATVARLGDPKDVRRFDRLLASVRYDLGVIARSGRQAPAPEEGAS